MHEHRTGNLKVLSNDLYLGFQSFSLWGVGVSPGSNSCVRKGQLHPVQHCWVCVECEWTIASWLFFIIRLDVFNCLMFLIKFKFSWKDTNLGVEILYQDRVPTTFYKLLSSWMQLEFWFLCAEILYDLFSVVCIFVALDSCAEFNWKLGVRSSWVRWINSTLQVSSWGRVNEKCSVAPRLLLLITDVGFLSLLWQYQMSHCLSATMCFRIPACTFCTLTMCW